MENSFKESLTHEHFQNHFSCPQSVESHFSSVVKSVSGGNTRRHLSFNLLESREVSKIPLQEVVSKGGNVTQVFSQVMTPSLLYYMFFLYFLYVKGNVTSRKWRHPAQARLRLWPRPSILPQTPLQCLHLQPCPAISSSSTSTIALPTPSPTSSRPPCPPPTTTLLSSRSAVSPVPLLCSWANPYCALLVFPPIALGHPTWFQWNIIINETWPEVKVDSDVSYDIVQSSHFTVCRPSSCVIFPLTAPLVISSALSTHT